MNPHVRNRTDGGNCGWWCDLHQRWTGLAHECGACNHDLPPFRPERV